MDWGLFFLSLATGIGAGISYSLSGFAKTEDEDFDWDRFLGTVVIGCVSGIVVAITGWEVSIAHGYLINLGIIPVVENVFKAIKRKLLPKLIL